MDDFVKVENENTRFQTLRSFENHKKVMDELLARNKYIDLDNEDGYYIDPIYLVTIDDDPVFYGTQIKVIYERIYSLIKAPVEDGHTKRITKLDDNTFEYTELVNFFFFNLKLNSHTIEIHKVTKICSDPTCQ